MKTVLLLLCSSMNLAHATTFSESLRDLAPSAASEQETKTYVNPRLVLCQQVYIDPSSASYLCGDSLNSSYTSMGNGNEAWAKARAILETGSRLPGMYQQARGKQWKPKLSYAASGTRIRIERLRTQLETFKTSAQQYQNAPLAQSVRKGIQQLSAQTVKIPSLKQKLQALPAVSPVEPIDYQKILQQGVSQINRTRALPTTSKWIDDLNAAAASGDIAKLSTHLDSIHAVQTSGAAANLSDGDQTLIGQTDRFWFATDGVIASQRLSADGKALRQSLVPQLKTVSSSEEGSSVRREINRGLLSLGTAKSVVLQDPNKVGMTWGAMSFAIGADRAFQDGMQDVGKELIRRAKENIDFTLGLLPVAGSVNDLTQIVHGMVTGYDYTGHRMATADYALRGIGVVLGLLPLGSQIVKIGEKVVSEAFIDGARLIRNSGSGEKLAVLARETPEIVQDIAEATGSLLKDLPQTDQFSNTRKLLSELESIKNSGEKEHLKLISKLLIDAKIDRIDRLDIIRSFESNGIQLDILKENILATRWHHGGKGAEQFARYLGIDIIENAAEARKAFALPSSNQMLFYDLFEVKAGSLVIRGKVAPNFGQPGGATQIFVLDFPEDVLKLIRRIKTI